MVNLINPKQSLVKTFIGICLAGSFITFGGTEKVVASSGDNVFGLELHYRDSAFQCDEDPTQADIKVDVYDQNNTLLTTLSKGDRYTSADFDSINDLTFVYNVYNLSCISNGSSVVAEDTMLLGANDTVPSIDGFSGQASIEEMLVGLNSYEELFLTELGTSDTSSSAYDLQDVVLVVDNNPSSLAFAD